MRIPASIALILGFAGVAAAQNPSVVGQWAGPMAWPLVAVHATLLPNGKVLLYDDHTNNAGVQVWDPATGTLTGRPYNAENLFCSGHVLMTTGKVLVTGGHVNAYVGIEDATLFDAASETWAAAPNMAVARWYPTNTTLPDGRVLVTSGAINCPTCVGPGGSHAGIALIPEIYDPPANTWTSLTSASLSIPLYPHMYVLPDGRVLAAASQEDPIVSRALNLATQTWSTVDNATRDGGSSVMYRPGKILKSGSGRNPDYNPANAAATAYVLDTTLPSPNWRSVPAMGFARTQHNLTVLPDGNVLVVGGATTSDVFNTAAAVKAAEMWSPATETFTTLATMTEPRLYHSTAILLADGRVLVAGGGRFGPDFPSAEIYSPPYLFKGPRPTITAAPPVVEHGASFAIGTPDAAAITKVTLLGAGSVTHAFNAGQRYLELAFSVIAGGLEVQAPASGNLAPPGYYLLHVVGTDGVPSVASILRIPGSWEDAIAPTAPSALSASSSVGRVDLTWSPATDNVAVTLYNVHRLAAPGTPATIANRVGQSPATSFTDAGFTTGTYFYVVTAQDAVGNTGPASNEATASVVEDTTPPTAAVTSPASGAILLGLVPVTATAQDDVGVAGVQFLLDGLPLGSEDSVAPWSVDWNSGLSANGPHSLAARARDARGNLTTSATVPVMAANTQLQGLVAAYALDEGTGALVRDSSGNANRGNVTNALWTASGHSGSGLLFDGSTDYVQVPNSSSLNVSGAGLTIEMWANITASSAIDYVLLGKPWTVGTTGNPPYQFGVEYDANGVKTLDFYFGDTTGTRRGPYSMLPVTGAWTHLAFTYDGAAVKGYLDGVLKFSNSIAASIQARPTPVNLGVDGGLGQGYKGRLDDVRIYNRALSASEIAQDRASPVPAAVPPVPDGTFGSEMLAARSGASSIDLTWDVSTCPAKGYHVVYGALSTLPAYDVAGGVCGLGVSGATTWSGVPAGDLWFLVVGDDGGAVEGLWGIASAGPMKSSAASFVCGITGRINLTVCP